ncbi:MAG: penicillin-binding protein 2 [Alphaproteobacteria bacterium]|nr:penicillin-binding protein 2 [Alphaproteobacteria bacterium]
MMLSRENDKTKMVSHRTMAVACMELCAGLVLFGRMYFLQVINADRYRTMAEENRISTRLLAPPRGLIFDRFGQSLAQNNQNFRVLIISELTDGKLNEVLETLNKILPLTEHEIQRVKKEVRRSRDFTPVPIRENLSWEEMASIQLNAPDLPGIVIDEGLSRYYPHPEETAHMLGSVGSVSEKEQATTTNPLYRLPGYKIGKDGIELQYNDELCGKEGARRLEVNAGGRVIREIERDEGTPGKNLTLTIDARLQNIAYNALKGQSGSVVLLDIYSGEILAMVSTPGFNTNAFNRGLTQAEWDELIKNEKNPLMNKALSGLYSPGSTFKIIVALAALEAGVIKPDTKVDCKGYVMNGNQRFHCWKHQGHGEVNLREAIMHSCDIYFYEIAQRVGIDRISAMAKKFGFGAITGIDLPGEKSGLMPTRGWKETIRGELWTKGDTFNTGIGQGYVLATPLQLAVMVAMVANDGIKITPKLLIDPNHKEVDRPQNLNISKANLQLVKEGMFDVVNNPKGTARSARVNVHGGLIAGKTGTTQVKRITMKEREEGLKSQDEIPWKDRNHALFVSFGPTTSPRYAISVVVEHGGGGSTAAAPIAREVMKAALEMDPVTKPPVFHEKGGQ